MHPSPPTPDALASEPVARRSAARALADFAVGLATAWALCAFGSSAAADRGPEEEATPAAVAELERTLDDLERRLSASLTADIDRQAERDANRQLAALLEEQWRVTRVLHAYARADSPHSAPTGGSPPASRR